MPTRVMGSVAGCLVLLITLAHAQAPPSSAPPFALTRVTIIDPGSGAAQPGMTVVVRDGRIASVAPASASIDPGVRAVDASGKFLIPGLWDVHVHLGYSRSSALPLYVANGITTIRDTGSHLAEIDGWRAQVDSGARPGPRILRAGPMVNGQSFNVYQLVTNGPEQARGIVRALKQVGVDFIKIHRRVPRDDYFAIVEETRKQGLLLVGHIPMTVRPEEASDAGQLIEHTDTLYEGTFSTGIDRAGLPDAIDAFLAKDAAALFARFVRNQTPVTPVLVAWRPIAEPRPGGPLADPRFKYTARSARELAVKLMPTSKEDLALIARTYNGYRKTVRAMSAAGVTLLAGTDTSIPPRVPGFSLHDELEALVDAGVTPLDALRAATTNPSRAMGLQKDSGAIAVGHAADMVLLDANPLDDIRHTQRIAAVILRGQLLPRAELDGLLKLGEKLANEN